MQKLDSIWWHKAPENGDLASSHIAIIFCALVKCGVIVKDLLEFEFNEIPSNLSNKKLSPLDYCLAYTDGELFDDYIQPTYRKQVAELFESNKIYDLIADENFMSHQARNASSYTLECSWQNVDILAAWIKTNFVQ